MGVQNLAGQTLGQYELRELLGAGGMGAVYRGYQASLKRVVAIKLLPTGLASDPGYIERFNREAMTSAALEHPHIVPIYDYGTERDISYIVMRLLTGGSLSDRMVQHAKAGRPLPSMGEVRDLLKQLASALDYAHAQGVIHRDIKPGNVMFDNQGSAYLVDFGIARLTGTASSLTGTGMTVGTPAYMPPEQWRGDPVTPAADQYALGAMIYNVITGRLPFEADTPFALMHKHVNERATPPTAWRADIPDAVTVVLDRAMAKTPAERFPTVTAFAQAFERAVQGLPEQPTGIFSAPLPPKSIDRTERLTGGTPPAKPAARGGTNPLLWVVGIVVLLLLIGIAFAVANRIQQNNAASAQTQIALNGSQTAVHLSSATSTPQPASVTASASTAPLIVPSVATSTNAPPTAAPSKTLLPTSTPTLTATLDFRAVAQSTLNSALTLTATRWTPTPTVDSALTIAAEVTRLFAEGLTATATHWTPTTTLTFTPIPTLAPTFTPNPTAILVIPTLPPAPTTVNANNPIVFYSNRDGNNEIYVMNADGSNQRRLTSNNAEDVNPVWSPDGMHIAFASKRDGQWEIYVMNADGSNQHRLTVGGQGSIPTWSPDGTQIAFNSSRDGNVEIYVMNADGSNMHNITRNKADDWDPAWSPDGAQIAFASNREGAYQVFVMNPDGSNVTRLTNTPGARNELPAWSSNGSKIAFVSTRDGNREIYMMDANGANQRRLTNNPSGDYSPAWSPDGAQIVFQSDRDGIADLYIMNADGSNPHAITRNGDYAPSWQWPPSQSALTISTQVPQPQPTSTPDIRQVTRDTRLIVYQDPTTGSKQLTTLFYGDRIRLTGKTASADNFGWSEAVLTDGRSGWLIDKDGTLEPVDLNATTLGLAVGVAVTVNQAGNGMKLRTDPATTATLVRAVLKDTTMTIIDGPTSGGFHMWWKYRLSDGTQGWAIDVSGWVSPAGK